MTPPSASQPTLSIVAGGAGFIGSNLVRSLVATGREVVVIDNLSNGRTAYLSRDRTTASIPLIEADLADRTACEAAFERAASMGPIDDVWHMAANSDIPAGVADPDVDHRDTFLTTFEILRAMRRHGIGTLHFASSSAIYGDLGETPLHEAIGPLLPISNYGAMKLASEAQISAAAESFLTRANIFRFPNVVGVPATHGVILDFINKLVRDPTRLAVLGDGTQRKAYLHASDLVEAMLFVAARPIPGKVDVVNIGPVDAGVTVSWIAEQVVARVSPRASIAYGVGNKGWVGDVPRFNYSTKRLQSYGWAPRLGSEAAVQRAITEIARQQGL
jgi:UDP-glucose 4-epimerase